MCVQTKKCFCCGQPGHGWQQCPKLTEFAAAAKNDPRFYIVPAPVVATHTKELKPTAQKKVWVPKIRANCPQLRRGDTRTAFKLIILPSDPKYLQVEVVPGLLVRIAGYVLYRWPCLRGSICTLDERDEGIKVPAPVKAETTCSTASMMTKSFKKILYKRTTKDVAAVLDEDMPEPLSNHWNVSIHMKTIIQARVMAQAKTKTVRRVEQEQRRQKSHEREAGEFAKTEEELKERKDRRRKRHEEDVDRFAKLLEKITQQLDDKEGEAAKSKAKDAEESRKKTKARQRKATRVKRAKAAQLRDEHETARLIRILSGKLEVLRLLMFAPVTLFFSLGP
ncbi:unnamed protein product [Vitrella brassicaformis CCMP3155]|uniref:CCHC-type domain-containing protein n=1 Tax=Vitrella brassicaformis (strain CCMP3155) TaxID=1169540 RepID=A0A0G4EQ78_VITBC|nr:unnamed protein product [Vitrella brassicaformis CCMP3155]|eukprot:CEL99567.1 unnamed protein product [Vitrella brassicaformis CCMP3155]